MKASIVDLRYKMKDVLKALARNETVTVIYHGEEKGVIIPCKSPKLAKKIQDTPMFGMCSDKEQGVDEVMDALRGGRNRDL